ncbi:MAG: hypothetical protein HY815_26635, partial [Candidatus Riflebacteria bacterium]|nr:hypothetical protein [Candidatus Riflebacteria bacterium]
MRSGLPDTPNRGLLDVITTFTDGKFAPYSAAEPVELVYLTPEEVDAGRKGLGELSARFGMRSISGSGTTVRLLTRLE